ncbi:MAG: hypothetical protein U0869_18860 [Chloroflexota bacterium]
MSEPNDVRPTVAVGPWIDRRAKALWPRLDPRALARCRHDPRRIAALVSRRTHLTVEEIRAMLMTPVVSDDEIATWFG